jgi:hypothetical protein
MACLGCGSDWVTGGNVIRPSLNGKDCTSCPHCCKLSRCKERKRGRWHGPQGEPFRASVFKKKRRRAKRLSHCHHCGQKLKPRQVKYCHRSCFYAARNAGTQEWDRTKQTEGCYHRGGRWNNAISKKYVQRVACLDNWLMKMSGLWQAMIESNATHARQCETCSGPVGNQHHAGVGRFCSRACVKKWRGVRLCKCGAEVPNASAHSRPSCKECKRESRRVHKRMYGCYRRRCRTYGGHYNPSVKPRDVFENDHWRCHVCGKKTHKEFSVHDPRSATLDHHPVPLSKGGDHDWNNVRCCCFQCNSLKGAKWDGQRRMAFA